MKNLKIAVLIDGDNANSKSIEQTLAHIESLGDILIKRVYGDWSQSHLQSWKSVVNKFSIKPMHAFSYTKGKNSTDIALIIDAMDILHSNLVNAFAIVSSDCDFTGIIHRIKENGNYSIGVGKENSCISFKSACDVFLLDSEPSKNSISLEKVTNINGEEMLVESTRVKVKNLPGLKVIGTLDLSKLKTN
jgi:uncharacterized protein (TIGR00288 family)